MDYLTQTTLQIIATPLISPLMIGIIRKVKAHMQNRTGADILQPYRDLWKLFHKNETVSRDASWITTVAPYIVFTVTIVIGAGIPLLGGSVSPVISLDLLTIMYLIALGTFFLALSGMDAGGGFGGFGASREMTIAAITEGGLLFSFLPLALFAHSSHLQQIAAVVAPLPVTLVIPLTFACTAYIIAMLAETARFPFDNPATHLELTMIHEAMILEYSGTKLALMEWAAANKLFILLVIGAQIFMPWTPSVTTNWQQAFTAIIMSVAKVLVLALGIAWLESSIAKFRFFRLPDLLIGSFILGIIGIILTRSL